MNDLFDRQFHRMVISLNNQIEAGQITRKKLVDKIRKYLIKKAQNRREYLDTDVRCYVSNLFDDALERAGLDPLSSFEISENPLIFHSV